MSCLRNSSDQRKKYSTKSAVVDLNMIDSNASFLRAAKDGNLSTILDCLKNNIDINTSNANGLNGLHLAAKEGHVEIVTELLKRGANVNAATKKGNTALHIASLAGQEDVVKVLVSLGANVNVQSQNGFTPLYMAAQENHDNVVSFLLANGANQSLATEDGFTPLAVALQQGHDKVVAVLLENDTKGRVRLPALHIAAKKDDCKAATLLLQSDYNPDVTSKSGFTPLHIAAHYGNERIANILLDRGADVNYIAKHQITPLHVASKWGKANMVDLLIEKGAKVDPVTRDGLTPLHCAARSGHDQVVDLLLEKGAPILAKTKNGLAPLHMATQGDHVDSARILLCNKAPVDDVTVDYLTALHVAAHCGHVKVAKLLLDRKADPNARALNGFTPLHIACKKNRMKVVELLLKNGASIEATTESGLSPLHVASFMGCMNIVIHLIQSGANPDLPTVRGETPLHLAARANQIDIIRILLRNGANVDATAREDQTPLHIAARLGNVDIVSLLLQHGAAVDATTKDMYTALHIAAKEGQEEVAIVLTDHNASLTSSTKRGFTPLHLAAKYGNIKVMKLLLQKDAPVDAQGKNGLTPLHVATHYNHVNEALLTLEKGASPHATAKNGYTPLHIAAKKNQMDIVTALLEYGAKCSAESKAGYTPLHLSSQEGQAEMSTLLIEHQADVNCKANNGLTPLHLCAQEDRVDVASVLVKNGAKLHSQTNAGYTPLHIASHFGHINMVRFLLQNNSDVHATTEHGYTPLHQASQQGHVSVVNLLLEHNASPYAATLLGHAPLSIAQRLGYISVVETLKTVTETSVLTSKIIEEKYEVISPEIMQETFLTDSEDEGGEDAMLGDQSYRYLTADEMKSLGDDSLPIDVTRDEKQHDVLHISKTTAAPMVEEDKLSPQHIMSSEVGFSEKFSPDNIDISHVPIHTGFLVSFMVDARGGAMRGCRHSGVRIIIPPRKAAMPMRITCRYLRKEKLIHPPPLMEGEACASRVLEMGPVGARFLGPVIIEVPHFASLRGKEREITILRSDTGESWREHTLEASEEAVQDVLNESFEGDEFSALEDLNTTRITRILTTDFPQYFAIITRIRQEVHTVGPEGGRVTSTVVPQVQAVFPDGALQKKIKVCLQAQPIAPELVTRLLGNRVAVSPIVTLEPRRRKFHKEITLTIPVPQAASKGMINQYNSDAPTLRLLCSITGSTKSAGSSKAQWEDVTGSTSLTIVNECVSFTTTVSARFWLMDCRQLNEATRFATEIYQEAIHVPFMAKFVVFAKRNDPNEAQMRVFCMSDDKEDKTLETQEHFTEIAKSRDVEVLEDKLQYLEFAGNLLPVTNSGEQLKLTFQAFHENRLPFNIRMKDQHGEPVGRVAFMREPKVGRGEAPQIPVCNLNIALPELSRPSCFKQENFGIITIERSEKNQDGRSEVPHETYHVDLLLSDIARELDKDWVILGHELGVSQTDVSSAKASHPQKNYEQALSMLYAWYKKFGRRAAGEELKKALDKINRNDILKQCTSIEETLKDKVELIEQEVQAEIVSGHQNEVLIMDFPRETDGDTTSLIEEKCKNEKESKDFSEETNAEMKPHIEWVEDNNFSEGLEKPQQLDTRLTLNNDSHKDENVNNCKNLCIEIDTVELENSEVNLCSEDSEIQNMSFIPNHSVDNANFENIVLKKNSDFLPIQEQKNSVDSQMTIDKEILACTENEHGEAEKFSEDNKKECIDNEIINEFVDGFHSNISKHEEVSVTILEINETTPSVDEDKCVVLEASECKLKNSNNCNAAKRSENGLELHDDKNESIHNLTLTNSASEATRATDTEELMIDDLKNVIENSNFDLKNMMESENTSETEDHDAPKTPPSSPTSLSRHDIYQSDVCTSAFICSEIDTTTKTISVAGREQSPSLSISSKDDTGKALKVESTNIVSEDKYAVCKTRSNEKLDGDTTDHLEKEPDVHPVDESNQGVSNQNTDPEESLILVSEATMINDQRISDLPLESKNAGPQDQFVSILKHCCDDAQTEEWTEMDESGAMKHHIQKTTHMTLSMQQKSDVICDNEDVTLPLEISDAATEVKKSIMTKDEDNLSMNHKILSDDVCTQDAFCKSKISESSNDCFKDINSLDSFCHESRMFKNENIHEYDENHGGEQKQKISSELFASKQSFETNKSSELKEIDSLKQQPNDITEKSRYGNSLTQLEEKDAANNILCILKSDVLNETDITNNKTLDNAGCIVSELEIPTAISATSSSLKSSDTVGFQETYEKESKQLESNSQSVSIPDGTTNSETKPVNETDFDEVSILNKSLYSAETELEENGLVKDSTISDEKSYDIILGKTNKRSVRRHANFTNVLDSKQSSLSESSPNHEFIKEKKNNNKPQSSDINTSEKVAAVRGDICETKLTALAFDNSAFVGADLIDACEKTENQRSRSPYEVLRNDNDLVFSFTSDGVKSDICTSSDAKNMCAARQRILHSIPSQISEDCVISEKSSNVKNLQEHVSILNIEDKKDASEFECDMSHTTRSTCIQPDQLNQNHHKNRNGLNDHSNVIEHEQMDNNEVISEKYDFLIPDVPFESLSKNDLCNSEIKNAEKKENILLDHRDKVENFQLLVSCKSKTGLYLSENECESDLPEISLKSKHTEVTKEPKTFKSPFEENDNISVTENQFTNSHERGAFSKTSQSIQKFSNDEQSFYEKKIDCIKPTDIHDIYPDEDFEIIEESEIAGLMTPEKGLRKMGSYKDITTVHLSHSFENIMQDTNDQFLPHLSDKEGCEDSSTFIYGMQFEKDIDDQSEEAMDVDSDQFSEEKEINYAYGMRFEQEHELDGDDDDIPGYGDLYTHQEEDEETIDEVEKGRISERKTDFDILAGRKCFAKNGELDDVSVSSLQEFERLEEEIRSGRRLSIGSLDSFNGKQYISKSGEHDDVSMNSLTEFEKLERECLEPERLDICTKDTARLSEIEEGQESLTSETSQETSSDLGRGEFDILQTKFSDISDNIVENQNEDKLLSGRKLPKTRERAVKHILMPNFEENDCCKRVNLHRDTEIKTSKNEFSSENIKLNEGEGCQKKMDEVSFFPLPMSIKVKSEMLEQINFDKSSSIPSNKTKCKETFFQTSRIDDLDQDSLHEEKSIKPDSLSDAEYDVYRDSLHEDRSENVDSLQDEIHDSLHEKEPVDQDSLHEMDILPDESSISLESSFAAIVDVSHSHDSLSKKDDTSFNVPESDFDADSLRGIKMGATPESGIISHFCETTDIREKSNSNKIISSSDSLEGSSSIIHAAYQFETESLSCSFNSAQTPEDCTMISSTDISEPETLSCTFGNSTSNICAIPEESSMSDSLDFEGNFSADKSGIFIDMKKEAFDHTLDSQIRKTKLSHTFDTDINIKGTEINVEFLPPNSFVTNQGTTTSSQSSGIIKPSIFTEKFKNEMDDSSVEDQNVQKENKDEISRGTSDRDIKEFNGSTKVPSDV